MMATVELAPYQNKVLQSTIQFILMHGGRGSGKSATLIMDLYNTACKYPKASFALLCNDLVQLRTSTHETLIRYLDEIGCPYQYNKVEKILTFPNGTQVHELTFEKDKTSLKGAEWDAVYVDEADGRNTTEDKLDYLIDSCRGKNGDRRIRIACNPVPPGHFLAKRFFIKPRARHQGYKVSTYMNAINLPEDYIPNLEEKYGKGTDEWKRWMMGEMISLQGAVYKEFNEQNIVEPKDIPILNAWCYGVDLGVHDPMVILEGGVDVLGTLYITNMYYKAGLDITQHIPLFQPMIKPDWPMFVDHSATQHSIMKSAGLNVNNAWKDVEEGIQMVSARFISNSIKISTVCAKLIEELYTYQWKPTSTTGREAPAHANSHSPDALRYLVCGLDRESVFDEMEW